MNTVTKAVIPVAGWGTRMLPITKVIEKCMLPVGTRPVVDYIVQDVIRAGITDIYFVVGEQSSQLQSFYRTNIPLNDYLRKKSKDEQLSLVAPLKGVKIANLLTELGARVCAYDPKANDEARHELRDTIAIEESLASALGNSEIIFITTNWNEFLDIDFNTLSMKQPLMIVDAVNMLNPNGYKSGKIRYIGVGR